MLACVFLSIFGEVMLSPFYPQFFQKVFHIDDLSYTGFYIFVCRLTVVLCSPLWGLLTRKFCVKRLLLIGQGGTAICTALLATASSAEQFVMLTVLLLLFKSSYMLVYPLLIEVAGPENKAPSAGSYHAVYHTAIIFSSIAGVGMINMANPLVLFYWVGVTDILQLLLCWFVLRGVTLKKKVEKQAVLHKDKGSRKYADKLPLIYLGITLLGFHLAVNMVRPYFTIFTGEYWQLSLTEQSILYFLPNAIAVFSFVLVQKMCAPQRLRATLMIGLSLLAVTLALQGIEGSIVSLIASRCMFGVFLILSQAALEVVVFSTSSSDKLHMNYSFIVSFQNIGQLLAPLLASAIVINSGYGSPFYVAAIICLFSLVFLWRVLLRQKQGWMNIVDNSRNTIKVDESGTIRQ
nr:MFS transporter [Paenibacillus sp. GSMTC-2017]